MSDPFTIGVLCPIAGGFFFGGILSGIVHATGAAGGRVISIQTLNPGLHEATPVAPEFSLPIGWTHIRGVISVAEAVQRPYLRQLRAAGLPVVTISNDGSEVGAPNVVPDNRGGVTAAISHLVAHGHRRIAFVGNMGQSDIRERYEAYRQALREHGVRPDRRLLFPSEDNITSGGLLAGRALVAAGVPSTAVLAATDRNAFGVMQALREAGLSLPDDQAIIGFDGVEEYGHIEPALSTVGVHFEHLGEVAADLLLRAVAGHPPEPRQYLTAASLLVRASCGCAGGAGTTRASAAPSTASHPGTAGGAGTGNGVVTDVAGRLAAAMRGVLMPEPTASAAANRQLDAAARTVVDVCRQSLRDATAVPPARLTAVAAQLYRLGACRDLVPRIVEAMRGVVTDLTTGAAEAAAHRHLLDAALTDLALAFGQLESREHMRFEAYLESVMSAQYDVGMALLRGDQDDPTVLSWFGHTDTPFACLGLWADGPAQPSPPATHPQPPIAGRPLRIAGVYGGDAQVGGLLGREVAIADFPPPGLLDRLDVAAGEALFVVAVKTDDSDWGLLAAPGRINTRSTAGRENVNHWAALLAVALKQKSQRDALTVGYQRERDLVDSLRTSEERYAIAARAVNDGLWDWDLVTDCVFYSARWSALLGYDERGIGVSPEEWLSRVHAEDLPGLELAIRQCRQGITPGLEREHRMRVADGSYRWVLCRALAVHSDTGHAVRLVGSLTDIDDRKRLEAELRLGALYDSVTKLANRTLFLDRLKLAIETTKRRPGMRFAVLFCDLDDFKVINDSLGHIIGDMLLTHVAGRLVNAIRGTDIAARFGGDEFAILLNDVAVAEVPLLVRRVQDAIAGTPFDVQGHNIVVTTSIGVAIGEAGRCDPVALIRDADTAMYQAKTRERGTHQIFDDTMHRTAVRRLSVEVELRRALEQDEFELHYQPLVGLEHRRAHGFEALLRWRHPERGYVPPGEYLAVAEETGLILPLGKWIIEEACRQAAAFRSFGGPDEVITVSVNISNRQFWHGGLLRQAEAALAACGLTPEYLRLEITEGVIMRSPEQAQRTMQDLRRHGLRLHIDDFGTGYSSLESLHRFPIEVLKIDRSFVAALGSDGVAHELVCAIVTMARAIGVDVIAEGVETAEQALALRAMGCQSGQGFYFGRPVPGPDAAALIGLALPALAPRSPHRAGPAGIEPTSRVDSEQIRGEQIGGEQIGGEQIGSGRVDREQVDREQVDREQVGGERAGGEWVDREQMGGEQVGREQMGGERVGGR